MRHGGGVRDGYCDDCEAYDMTDILFAISGILVCLLFLIILVGCSYAAWLSGQNQQMWFQIRARLIKEILEKSDH
jgi:hypothetical protein